MRMTLSGVNRSRGENYLPFWNAPVHTNWFYVIVQ
jgi:hypothetical protein